MCAARLVSSTRTSAASGAGSRGGGSDGTGGTGLTAGEKVVIAGVNSLADGELVNPETEVE